jgi:hypothetical protein
VRAGRLGVRAGGVTASVVRAVVWSARIRAHLEQWIESGRAWGSVAGEEADGDDVPGCDPARHGTGRVSRCLCDEGVLRRGRRMATSTGQAVCAAQALAERWEAAAS